MCERLARPVWAELMHEPSCGPDRPAGRLGVALSWTLGVPTLLGVIRKCALGGIFRQAARWHEGAIRTSRFPDHGAQRESSRPALTPVFEEAVPVKTEIAPQRTAWPTP